VAKRIALGGFDAVHIEVEGPLGSAARKACIKRGIPFTAWYHTRIDLYLGLYIFKPVVAFTTMWLRRFHNKAVRTMVSTASLKAHLDAQGFTNVVVVPLGVDVNFFVRNLAPKVPELQKPVFAYFSRLAPEKSPQEFFDLDLPGTKLVIGDGPLRHKLEKKYGATHHFTGFKVGQELVDWLSRADVMIFPSRTETLGMVTLEAMACGVPVVAHDVMGPKDIITNDVDGYLTDDFKTGALKALTLDRAKCREKAMRFSWEKATEALVANLAIM
jgi:glycosyltransferase involved in cell wall biosynthesis